MSHHTATVLVLCQEAPSRLERAPCERPPSRRHSSWPPAPPRGRSRGRPIELSARDLQGREVDVAADAGAVRLVDFWATWCEPCREQLPALERMRRELGPRGLSIYAVSFDEDPAQIPRFLEGAPVGFRILWDRGGA